MAQHQLARSFLAGIILILAMLQPLQADGGCVGKTTASSGYTWLIRSGQMNVLLSEQCIRNSDVLETEAGASQLLRVNGFGILGMDGATKVHFDAHYFNPAQPELSVLSIALLGGSARYASRFPRPFATAQIKIPHFDSAVQVFDGTVHVELQNGYAVVRVIRGGARVVDARGKAVELVAPATLLVPADDNRQRKNREETE